MTRKQNTLRTCPICGWTERRSDCVLGKECRQKYDVVAATAIATGGQAVDIFDFAETEGRKTLEQLNEKLQKTEEETREIRRALWNRAEIQLKANLAGQSETFRMTEGIYHRAKVQIFRNLYTKDQEYQRLSRKARGIKKAIECLQHHLDIDVPRMREDCKEKTETKKVDVA